MITNTRRAFLGNLSGGMVAVGVGTTLASRTAFALGLGRDLDLDELSFGDLEPLASLIQETSPGKLQGILIEKLNGGTNLGTLVAAGALANARTFGATAPPSPPPPSPGTSASPPRPTPTAPAPPPESSP